MVLVTRVICVEWNPDSIPQATVIKKTGMKCSVVKYDPKSNPLRFQLSHMFKRGYPFTKSIMKTPAADSKRIAPNIGYILPMILSIGNTVAIR